MDARLPRFIGLLIDGSIMIGISHEGLNDEWLDFDNNVLVNGRNEKRGKTGGTDV